MQDSRPMALYRLSMHDRAISDVRLKAILRIHDGVIAHQLVPSLLGDDRSGRNGRANPITLHDRANWYRTIQIVMRTIEQYKVWNRIEEIPDTVAGFAKSADYPLPINIICLNMHNLAHHCGLTDQLSCLGALLRAQYF